jgi:YHS domain-containing protein
MLGKIIDGMLVSATLIALLAGCGTDDREAMPPTGGSAGKAPTAEEERMPSAGGERTSPQTVCPVMGGKIDKSIFVDYDGKRIYFCCKACPAEFAKDPAKYVKKLEGQGTMLEKAPVASGKAPM